MLEHWLEHLASFPFLAGIGPVTQCLRKRNTPPREGEEETGVCQLGFRAQCLAVERKWATEGGTWHGKGKKCVIWFQEGSPDSE